MASVPSAQINFTGGGSWSALAISMNQMIIRFSDLCKGRFEQTTFGNDLGQTLTSGQIIRSANQHLLFP